MTESEKPSVLIIGGLGYLGRWLAYYIYTNKLASDILIVDKLLPQLASLAPEFDEVCQNVQFQQADMSREHSVRKVFEREGGSTFDFVFNCAGETKYGQTDGTYQEKNVDLPVACAKEAARRGVKLFVELSEGRVYGDGPDGKTETDELKPWLPLARFKLEAEKELQKIEGLNLVILRLANAYGPYSSKSISTAICHARVYQFLQESMNLLWTENLKVNTVHISDVNRAIWHVAQWYVAGKENWNEAWGTTPTFNIVDDGDTSQGSIAEIVEEVFDVKVQFVGKIISQYATRSNKAIEEAVNDANEEILGPWDDLLDQAGITRPGPITPFIELEQLKDSDLSLDGTRFKNVTGFKYDVPKMNTAMIEGMVESYKRMNWWP
ncbi:hypothetical protein H072_7097 [Dactylellina haptotyla CBS 200.50]|uniref:NAD-dependent epimerase/dehydratase domain-containing protein n=1 Tax=Dactylellina haptotyla (strain CBS 200.50) TaxID=1284197 RepID=S8A810_DACHA|nr:hypothetical protein H072_7097 [Dactylellina haptotyla CBS 200.50]